MSIIEYDRSYESAHYAIMDAMPYAERKHPKELMIQKRWDAVHKELYEVKEAIARCDWKQAMIECIHTGVTLYRLIRTIKEDTGVNIR